MRVPKLILAALGFLVLLRAPAPAQFTAEELSRRPEWERFLGSAEIVETRQLGREEGITRPWVLTLEKDGVTRKAIWKDVQGFVLGYDEHWQWEIAAYRLDRYLELGMVPPTVERRFWRRIGSCQLWVDSRMSLKEKNQQNIEIPPTLLHEWHRAMCKQRVFDNLIANNDRHQGNYLITADWRILLIDHSRTFHTSKEYTEKLIYCETHPDGPLTMREVPRSLYEKLKSLDDSVLKRAIGKYLTGGERKAVLARRDLIIQEIDRLQAEYGDVLY
jgi:hypothetical protein